MTVPLLSMKIDHYLAISDVYFKLGCPKIFHVELREKFYDGVYAPDIFTVWNRKAYLLEVQLKALSKKEWAHKWEKHNKFFEEDWKSATWQKYSKGTPIKPYFVAITKQDPDNVKEGFNVPERKLIVVKDIRELTRT